MRDELRLLMLQLEAWDETTDGAATALVLKQAESFPRLMLVASSFLLQSENSGGEDVQ